jgi:hypothetical protein
MMFDEDRPEILPSLVSPQNRSLNQGALVD